MDTREIACFSKEDEILIKLIVDVGVPRAVANCLTFLKSVPSAKSVGIEQTAQLRQPEVSVAIQYLIANGWIVSKKDTGVGKGRPTIIYALCRKFPEILEDIAASREKEILGTLTCVDALRNYNSMTYGVQP